MPSRFEMPQDPNPPEVGQVVDTGKRYDVYCTEHGVRTIVYRNVLFRGVRTLYSGGRFDITSIFLELEQANGQTVFISRHGLARFCEHGTDVCFEVVTSK